MQTKAGVSHEIDYQARCKELEKKVHNVSSLLLYHRKREKEFCLRYERQKKISLTEIYGPLLELANEMLYLLNRGATKESMMNLILRYVRKHLGTKGKTGKLVEKVNAQYDGLIDDLGKDYPDFGPLEKNLYCAMMINVDVDLVKEVFELGNLSHTYYLRNSLFKRIRQLRSRRRAKYLEYVD